MDLMSLLASPCKRRRKPDSQAGAYWPLLTESYEVIVSRTTGQKGTLVCLDPLGFFTPKTITQIKILMRTVLLSQNLFTAGTDTTSSTVEWALAELIKHPQILRKAQLELDSVVGQDRPVSESDLPNLPFIQAISKETFRLHPSTPLSLPRMSSEPCEVAGYYIPGGATLLVNVWAIARDPTMWHDPLQFHPARFLPGGGFEHMDVKGNDFGIIPFGAGRRICAGMSLGIRMVQFMIATLVHAFDWTLPEGQVVEKLDMEEAYGLTLQRAVPLMVHPVPRLAPAAYQT